MVAMAAFIQGATISYKCRTRGQC